MHKNIKKKKKLYCFLIVSPHECSPEQKIKVSSNRITRCEITYCLHTKYIPYTVFSSFKIQHNIHVIWIMHHQDPIKVILVILSFTLQTIYPSTTEAQQWGKSSQHFRVHILVYIDGNNTMLNTTAISMNGKSQCELQVIYKTLSFIISPCEQCPWVQLLLMWLIGLYCCV